MEDKYYSMNYITYEAMKHKPKLVKPNKKLHSPGGSIQLRGMFFAQFSYKGCKSSGHVYVLTEDNRCGNLLSREMSTNLKIVQFIGTATEWPMEYFTCKTAPERRKLHSIYGPYS